MATAGPLIACALLAAAAMLARGARARGWATLGALVFAPVLLAIQVWDTPAVVSLRGRPLELALLVAAGVVLIAVLARVFDRRPELLALAAAATVPFRVPIEIGDTVVNLLLPLYVVITAGALAYAVPRVFGDGEQHRPERRPHMLEWLLAATLVLYAVQTIGSIDQSKAVENTVFFYVPFALLFAQLARMRWTLQLLGRVLAVLVALGVIFALIGFVEYGTRHLLLNPKVIASNQIEPYFRVNSLFFDPNIYGRFLAIVMLGLTTVVLWTRRSRTLVVAGLLLAVLWAGLVLTLSQSSFAALLLGLAVLAALRWSAKAAIGGVLVAALVALAVVVTVPSHLGLTGSGSADKATSGRWSLVSGGVRLAEQRPLWGHGSGSFSRAYRRIERGSAERAVSASHTIPVTIAAEQGVPGLLLYVALLVVALVVLLRCAGGWPARAAIAAAFCALVLHTWTYAAFLEDPMTWVLLAVGLALALAPPPASEPESAAESAPAAEPEPGAAR